MSKQKKRYKVQVWIFCQEPELKVLVLKTNESRGSFWQSVTGSVEEGETNEEAALREAQEETGLKFKGKPFSLNHEFSFENQYGPAEETTWALEMKKTSEVILDPKEHVECQWVGPTQAKSLLKFETNREGLQKLVDILKSPEGSK